MKKGPAPAHERSDARCPPPSLGAGRSPSFRKSGRAIPYGV